MYSTCLFCHQSLGANQSIEHFPVGTRLAYDAAKGRLWVVCTQCGRWNLSPLEERWEAIEAAERAYRDTKKRVATENVALARLRDGTDLIRIGAPLLPEFAAWRYGDTFGRRRRKHVLAAIGSVMGGYGLMFGAKALAFGGMVGPVILPVLMFHRQFSPVVKVADNRGRLVPVTRFHMPSIRIGVNAKNEVRLQFDYLDGWKGSLKTAEGWMERVNGAKPGKFDESGKRAEYALSLLLPAWNGSAGSARNVAEAVGHIESHGTLAAIAQKAPRVNHAGQFALAMGVGDRLPEGFRLALEMSLHEESERRAMEGELRELEQRWKDADEIAGIADNLTLSPTSETRIRKMRNDAGRAEE